MSGLSGIYLESPDRILRNKVIKNEVKQVDRQKITLQTAQNAKKRFLE